MEDRDRASGHEESGDGERIGPGSRRSHRHEHAPAVEPWVGIVANRGSGRGRGHRLVLQLCAELKRLGIRSRVSWTHAERRDLVAASENDPNCRCLVAAGGDGTVASLLNERISKPFAILPAGTENLTAAHFRHRRNPRFLAEMIHHGEDRPIDLGEAENRRFILMAGFGFDGDVVSRHHRGRVATTGSIRPTNRAAYVEPILRSSLSYKFPRIVVKILDGEEEEVLSGTTVFVFNLPRYALGLPFVPDAHDDDGWLDLLVFRKPGPFQALYYLWQVLWGWHLRDPGVIYRRVRRVNMSSEGAVPVQLDGDPAGSLGTDQPEVARPISDSDTPHRPLNGWDIRILPGAARVMVPSARHHGRVTAVPLARERRSR